MLPPAEGRRSSPASASSAAVSSISTSAADERSLQRVEGVLVEILLDLQHVELGGAHAAALLCVVQEGGEGWIQFNKGVSAQFIRAQQILQGVVSKPTLEVSAHQKGTPEASLTCTTKIFS